MRGQFETVVHVVGVAYLDGAGIGVSVGEWVLEV